MTNQLNQIQTADKQKPADLVFKQAQVVHVLSKEIETADVAVTDGKIVGIGSYEGREEVEMKGRYLAPGFIDGHVHIESSMVSPVRFGGVLLRHGVTSVITDPHEIANVGGIEGVQYMLDDAARTPLNTYFMLPSCVPATPFENSGAVLTAADLLPLYENNQVIGLAEVMDYPSVAASSPDMMQKIKDAATAGGNIDGHGAGFTPHQVNVYTAAGVQTDHECTTASEALDRIRRGMYVMIREGSAAKDLEALLPAVTEANARRFLFCTDDKHLDALLADGSIDDSIRLAVSYGMDPLTALQLATVNAAECFGLQEKGVVAPGYDADLVILDDLESLQVQAVYTNGVKRAEHGELTEAEAPPVDVPERLTHSVQTTPLSEDALAVAAGSGAVRCIDYEPNSIVTGHAAVHLPEKDGQLLADPAQDIMKMTVMERHQQKGSIGLGFIRGLTFDTGAFALTVAHDSHNLVAAGYEDNDIRIAADRIRELQGGLVLVKNGQITAEMPLPLAGLMSMKPAEEAAAELTAVEEAFRELGFSGDFNPLSALSFMCLPVIPSLKLTDMGYFDAEAGEHVSVHL
ncbi:adenine deaminase [Alkalicoccus chagannorensis]|uniref:adenine deaminase n=1 Tax=Alkalicoccus chagannorensis TaxID=427072 RepID=UPI00040860B6|nr:adenine deaminase [Alkalicoccus chagannorensis]